MTSRFTKLSLALALAAACSSGPQPKPPEQLQAEAAAAKADAEAKAAAAKKAAAEVVEAIKGPAPFDEKSLDKDVSPCDDFYQYACGGWMKNTPIPADRASWARSFSEIEERNEALIRQLLEEAAASKGDKDNPFAQKIGDFYAACMDEDKAETASLATVNGEFKKIDAVKTAKQLAALIAQLHLENSTSLFGFGASQDSKDATLMIGVADQGGLGLPDRDFYLQDAQGRKQVRDSYRTYIVEMLQLVGEKAKQAQADADAVMKIETALAKASQDRVERRDPYKVYHRIERKGLIELSKMFDWDTYFAVFGQPQLTAINVIAPDFFKNGFAEVLGAKQLDPKKLAALKTYLRWHALADAAPMMGKKFVDTRFSFVSKLTGAKQLLPRWKRCVSMTSDALPEAVGRSFVSRAFGPQSKPQALDMVQRIEAAFEANLATLTWMDDETKARSKEKLHKMVNKIGFPDQWRDYSAVAVDRGSLLANSNAAAVFESKRQLAKIGKPVDRAEHGMPPQMVNAQYNPSMNDMTFPAAILQPPFFLAEAQPAANYGGMGMVMGHELTHGFDDQGRQFDGSGNLIDWWTPASGKAYSEKAACVSKQYGGYITVEDVHLNGDLTLGENIADNGGVKMALAALHELNKGKNPTQYQGFSDDQQYFIAFAQAWCTNTRPEAERLQAQTNEHSTAHWRVNGTVSNTSEFEKAFACKPGSKMAPADRCGVW